MCRVDLVAVILGVIYLTTKTVVIGVVVAAVAYRATERQELSMPSRQMMAGTLTTANANAIAVTSRQAK